MTPTTRAILILLSKLFTATGTAITGAMIQAGGYVVPSAAVWLFGVMVGFTAAWAQVEVLVKDPTTLGGVASK